jgi:beta-galactosidase
MINFIESRRLSRTCAILLAGGIFVSVSALYAPLQMRTVQSINKTWKFIKQDVAVSQGAAIADPSGWLNVNLPHSFDIPYWRVGSAQSPQMGWYRKHIEIDQSVIDAKKRVFIEFEAAFQIADVYVNGTYVGQHKGGYTGFFFDITQNVKAGDNVIAVRLDARWTDTVAPISGEHVFIGGIYRNVSLVITDPLHVTWYGTFVTTPQVSAVSATVKVKTEIKNDGTTDASCKVKTIVVDSTGTQVTSFESTQNVPAGATVTFVQTSSPISSPHLWSPSSPYMYRVYTEIYNGTVSVDNFESPLGIRSIKWTTNGFELNGQRLWLHGANVHQDHAGWGDATASTGSFRDVKLIKDCGMNFIRGSHYPHAPAFADACDRLGVCFWSEMCFWGFQNYSQIWNAGSWVNKESYKKNVLDECREMIRINRNHPSIIIWCMGNELWFTTNLDSSVALLTREIALTHSEDSTRLAALGGCENNPKLQGPIDVAGFNGGQTPSSSIPSLVSEYGLCTDDGAGYDPCWGNMTSTFPASIAGISLWCAFDHGSNANFGIMGMINNARVPQKRWYYYRNLNLGIAPPTWPVSGTAAKLKLTTDRDTITDDGRSDCQLIVQVQDASGKWLTNSPDITLTDKSGLGSFPTGTPTGTSITFHGTGDGGIQNGQAAIEYRSYNAGTVTIEATSQGLTSSSVTIFVKHIDDSPIANALRNTRSPVPTKSIPASIIQFTGKQIQLPGAMRGQKVNVSVYDLQGRLIESRVIVAKSSLVMLEDVKAEGVAITKLRVMEK